MADPGHTPGGGKRVTAALVISAAVLLAALWLTGTFKNTEPVEELYKDLCDSFFVVGTLFICAGGLIAAAKNSTFNFFTYNGRALFSFIIPSRREEKRPSYHDYCAQKEQTRKSWRVWHILAIGGAYCALGALFLALFYSVS